MFIFLFSFAVTSLAEEEWAIMVEPSFVEAKVRRPVADSVRTVLVATRLVNGQIEPLAAENPREKLPSFDLTGEDTILSSLKEMLGIKPRIVRDKNDVIPKKQPTFDEIRGEALRTASQVLASIKPRIVRDKNNVVQYVVLESDNPLTASCVLAPEFASQFHDILGPEILVAMPHRNLVLVFSRQDNTHLKMAEPIVSGYLNATWPVSREVFSLENGSLRSLGVLQ
ncbi:MAG: hypothetical protein NTZ94_06180 [Verrucomicrobia bacterium]|nr:hypothetical protein [Verrucomicrobiota bacterium]